MELVLASYEKDKQSNLVLGAVDLSRLNFVRDKSILIAASSV